MHAHIYLFWSYREDGELEDGEIDDEGISIEEVKETKEESEEAEKDKDKEKEREKDDKSHRHSRKRHRKIKEKRRSKRRRRDRQKVIYHCVFFFWQMSIVFTFSFMLFFPNVFPIQHHSPSSGSSSDSYDSDHERQDRPKSKKSKGTYRDHDGELAQVSSGFWVLCLKFHSINFPFYP